MLEKDARKRISIEKVMEHPWIAKRIKNKKLKQRLSLLNDEEKLKIFKRQNFMRRLDNE
jgi:hypothetical protein